MEAPMPDEADWSVATFAGNRRRQQEEFRALPFREKVARIEQMSAVAARLVSHAATAPQEANGAPSPSAASPQSKP